MLGRRLEIAADEREQADEVAAVPVAVDIGLAEADARARAELCPERVRPPDVDDDRRACAVAEAPAPPVRVTQDDLAPLKRIERTKRESPGDAWGEAHRFTEPRPATKGGFR